MLHYIYIGQSKELYRMFILSLFRTWQLYRSEGLHSPTYAVTAAVLSVTTKVKLCVFLFICLTVGSPTENRGRWEWLAVMQSHTCARRTVQSRRIGKIVTIWLSRLGGKSNEVRKRNRDNGVCSCRHSQSSAWPGSNCTELGATVPNWEQLYRTGSNCTKLHGQNVNWGA